MRVVVLIAVCVTACSVDLETPAEARITCDSNDQCPAPTICKRTLGLCVSSVGDDGQAPALAEVAITPGVATIGGELTLSFATDEPLAVEPDVVLGAGGPFTLLSADAEMRSFVASYIMRGTEAPGQRPISVTLVDAFGNATQVVAATVALDFVAPRLGAASWLLPGAKRAVKPGDAVTLVANVDADTSLVQAVLYADDAELADVTDAFVIGADEGGNLRLRGDVVIPADAADGALLSVGFVLGDPAGNATNPRAALSPALPVDALPPQGTFSLPSSSIAKAVSASLASVDAISVRFEGDVESPLTAQSPVPIIATIVLSDGNGSKSVVAIFEDAAGNQTSTAPSMCDLQVPPGPGSPGLPCAAPSECNSLTCACADATCSTRRCAASAACDPCHYVNASGVCVGTVNNAIPDAGRCSAPQICATGGLCKTDRTQDCSLGTDCITGHCGCNTAACPKKICTDVECGPCRAGMDCTTNRNNDADCGGGKVCRVGQCVVRDPGDCESRCNGNLTCGPRGVSRDDCNTAQGFSAHEGGTCPPSPPCAGSPTCSCF